MKKVIIALLALTAFAGNAFAADVIEMKKGVAHQVAVNDCTKCHSTAAGGKIEGFGKDIAHKTCKDCHAAGKGPTSCKECHK